MFFQMCKMPKSNFSFLGVTFMFGGHAEMTTLTLTLQVVPNVATCLNPTFHFWCDIYGWRYAEMTHPNPNPSSCSKCCKMPKSNFSFLGVTFMFGGHAEMTQPNPNPSSCSKCCKMPKSNFSFLV